MEVGEVQAGPGDGRYLLAVDVGNTDVTCGLYGDGSLQAVWRLFADTSRTADEYVVLLDGLFRQRHVHPLDIHGVVVGSVVPQLTDTVRQALRALTRAPVLVVGPGTRTGVRLRADNPHEVGVDRVLNAAAVQRRYGTPAIVIDFGTATTFDVVSPEGDYLGGAIAPGLATSVDALVRHTAQLRRVEIARPPSVIGRNTVAAMQSGAFYGYVALVEGLLARIEAELGARPVVIATGGLASVIARDVARVDHIDPDITLEGLRLVYEMNTP